MFLPLERGGGVQNNLQCSSLQWEAEDSLEALVHALLFWLVCFAEVEAEAEVLVEAGAVELLVLDS